MPNLKDEESVKKIFEEFDARTEKIAEHKANLDELYKNREELRRTGMSIFPRIDKQISIFEERLKEEAANFWSDINGVDLSNGGQNYFVDSVIKFCGALPKNIPFPAATAINKLYEQRDYDGINKLIESDERFEEAVSLRAERGYSHLNGELAAPANSDIDKAAFKDIVVNSLHEKVDGKENTIFQKTFGTFYNTVAFCDKIADDKEFLKSIYHDDNIPKEYKNQLKRAMQTYKFQEFENRRLTSGATAKIIGSGVASLPGLAVSLAGGITSGVIKLGEGLVSLATSIAAFPTELAYRSLYEFGKNTDNTVGKAALYTAGTIFAIPTTAIKLAGGLTVGVLKLGEFAVDSTISLISYPLLFPLRNAIYTCVGTLPKTKKSEKVIKNNITKLIKEIDADANLDNLEILCTYDRVDRKLIVKGTTESQEYKFEFDVGSKDAAAQIEVNMENMFYAISKGKQDLIDELSGKRGLKKNKADEQILGEVRYSLQQRKEAKVIADITSQRPLENASEKNSNIYVELE